MKHEALVTHTPFYRDQLSEYEKEQRKLLRRVKSSELSEDKIFQRAIELDDLRKQLAAYQWQAPQWRDIDAAIPTELSSEERLTHLDKIRDDLAQHISEVCSAPLVQDKTHVDIDKIDVYLDGLNTLLTRIDIERDELQAECTPTDTQPSVPIVKEVTPVRVTETEPDMDALATKKILTFAEAAAYLGIAEHTLENRISDGSIPEMCIDPASPTGRKRRFYREKLGQVQRAKRKRESGDYEKIRWLSTEEKLERLLKSLTDQGYLELVNLPKLHFTDKDGSIPTKHPLDWRYNGKNGVALAHLASLVYILHRKGALELSGPDRSLHIPSYMVSHFTLNGKPIAKRTAEEGTASIRLSGRKYAPHSAISKITTMVFGTS